jgi:gliding motility-associated-like protein
VGGELLYDFLGKDADGKDRYRITLKVYRDCGPGTAQFDGIDVNIPAVISIREVTGSWSAAYNIGIPVVMKVPLTINNPCFRSPDDVCVEEAVYTMTISLAPVAGGYYIVYQRCCRNYSINNLVNPGQQGVTYYTRIPGPETVSGNSSPRFVNFPPVYLCANYKVNFDHSAIDTDGDSLVYEFYTPFVGIDYCCTFIGNSAPTGSSITCPVPPAICPQVAPPPPYTLVNYAASYSGNYPITSSPAFSLNPVTGLLTGVPIVTGQFVVGICAKEYRKNVLINIHYRDFQFNIKPCIAEIVSGIKDQGKLCEGSTVTFTNLSKSSSGPPPARWDFGVPVISSDTSRLFEPTYVFPDTGKFTVTLIADPGKPCADTIKKDFLIYPQLDISLLPNPPQCLLNNAFDFSVTGKYHAITKFRWEFSTLATPSVAFVKDPTGISFSRSALHTVKLFASHFTCRDSLTDTVRVVGALPNSAIHKDTTVVVGEFVPLNAYMGYGYTYSWTPVIENLNCSPCVLPDAIAHAVKNITYTVLVEDFLHCSVTRNTFAILVDLKSTIDVPSAFTPNGDGINDRIFVAGWGLKKLLYFRVFNRWGQLLFETDDLKSGWDGRFDGVMQNMDTYVFQVKAETWVEDKPLIEKAGTFQLIK